MRKTLFIITILILSTGLIQSAITVTAPNGGEKWFINSKSKIQWNTGGHGGNVKIRLRKGSTGLGFIVESTPNDGEYEWTINTLTNAHVIQAGSDYSIKITLVSNSDIKDTSDNTFQISQLLQIKPFLKKMLVFKPKPDLHVAIATNTNRWHSQMSTFTFTVNNSGLGSSSSPYLAVWFSYLGADGSRTSDPHPEYWHWDSIGSISAGSHRAVTKTHSFGVPGKYRLKAHIDQFNSIDETNEGNNITTHDFWVTEYIFDLVMSILSGMMIP